MSSIAFQALLLQQERARIERLARNAWQHHLADAPTASFGLRIKRRTRKH